MYLTHLYDSDVEGMKCTCSRAQPVSEAALLMTVTSRTERAQHEAGPLSLHQQVPSSGWLCSQGLFTGYATASGECTLGPEPCSFIFLKTHTGGISETIKRSQTPSHELTLACVKKLEEEDVKT